MHFLFITAQIITQPRLVQIKNQKLLVMLVVMPNNKKKVSFILLPVYLNNYLVSEILALYTKKSFILIEGVVNINKVLSSSKKQYIELKGYKIQSYTIN